MTFQWNKWATYSSVKDYQLIFTTYGNLVTEHPSYMEKYLPQPQYGFISGNEGVSAQMLRQ
jgi:hypothetical protein